MTESAIIIALKSGDQSAYRKLIENYQVPLLKICRGFLHNDHDASDIVQDTFIEVFLSVSNFRGESKLSTWLYRIAVNKCLNLLRKRKLYNLVRFDKLTPNNNPQHEIFDEAPLPGHALENRERTRLVKKTVDLLPANQRIAFILHKYQDLAYKEIAEVMGISVASVESLLHRARLNLHKKLYTAYKKNLL
jgi:RNA polymerase sigma-70 factor (ECF subfamily)